MLPMWLIYSVNDILLIPTCPLPELFSWLHCVKFCLVAINAYLAIWDFIVSKRRPWSWILPGFSDDMLKLFIFIQWLLCTGDQKWGARNGQCCANGQSRKCNTFWIFWLLSSTFIFFFYNVLDRTNSHAQCFYVPNAPWLKIDLHCAGWLVL